jgi:hypothetical protein
LCLATCQIGQGKNLSYGWRSCSYGKRCKGKGRGGIDNVVFLCSFSLQYCIYCYHPSGYQKWRQTRSLWRNKFCQGFSRLPIQLQNEYIQVRWNLRDWFF